MNLDMEGNPIDPASNLSAINFNQSGQPVIDPTNQNTNIPTLASQFSFSNLPIVQALMNSSSMPLYSGQQIQSSPQIQSNNNPGNVGSPGGLTVSPSKKPGSGDSGMGISMSDMEG
jgi:hypothetical protein